MRRAIAPAVLRAIKEAAVFEPGEPLGRNRRARAGTATLACTLTPPTLAQRSPMRSTRGPLREPVATRLVTEAA